MIALYILGGILLLLLFLLWMPVSVRFAWRGGTPAASLHYLFLRFPFSPEQLAKLTEKETVKEVQKEEKKLEKQESKSRSVRDTAQIVWSLVKSSGWGLGYIRRRLLFYRVEVYIAVGGPDAHQTGMRYGMISSAVHTALGILGQLFRLRSPIVYIAPVFTQEETRFDVSFRLRLRPLTAVVAGAHIFFRFLRTLKKDRANRPKQPRQPTRKGGRKHEPTASHQ